MKYSFLFILFLSFHALGFDKDFKTVNDRVPFEFVQMFEALKSEVKSPAEQIKMIGLCKDLDSNLGFLPKEQIYLLIKSEVIKNILEHKFKKVRQFDITTAVIQRLEDELLKKKQFLNAFSLWIWRSMIAELKHRQDMGLITTKSFSLSGYEGAKLGEAKRFQRYLEYILPWIERMDSYTPTQFNDLSKEVSWIILRRLNDRSLLFKRFSSTAAGDTKITLFNIPEKLLNLHPEDIKRMQSDVEPLSLKEEGMIEKADAQKAVDKTSPEDLSPISDDVARELEKKTEKNP